MTDKKLNRMFDRVKLSQEREEAILADLLCENKEVSSMKQTNRRRVPAAALAAAVLAVVLAGTALAAEHFGWITIDRYEDGYSVQADLEPIPQSSLTDDVLRLAETATDTVEILPFQSWDEAEAYLGLEIADNARLDQMKKHEYGLSLGTNEKSVVAPCLIWLESCEALPCYIMLKASYIEGNFTVNEESVLLVENPALGENRSHWFGKPESEMISTERYITPSGLETAIVTSLTAAGDNTKYEAQFILNQALFRIGIKVDRGESGEEAILLLKEILDAYE